MRNLQKNVNIIWQPPPSPFLDNPHPFCLPTPIKFEKVKLPFPFMKEGGEGVQTIKVFFIIIYGPSFGEKNEK